MARTEIQGLHLCYGFTARTYYGKSLRCDALCDWSILTLLASAAYITYCLYCLYYIAYITALGFYLIVCTFIQLLRLV